LHRKTYSLLVIFSAHTLLQYFYFIIVKTHMNYISDPTTV